MTYLVFAGDTYYPIGGIGDLQAEVATLEEAHALVAAAGWDWWQIVQLDGELRYQASGECGLYGHRPGDRLPDCLKNPEK